jgi:hypothetical protein
MKGNKIALGPETSSIRARMVEKFVIMKKAGFTLLSLFILSLLLPAVLVAQTENQDDPFKRDPIFSQSLDELFGTSNEKEEDSEAEEYEFRRAITTLSQNGVDLGGNIEAGPYYSNSLYSLYPNLPTIHFNRVNGLFLGYRKERMQWHRQGDFLDIPQIQLHGHIGWGTASKRWEYAVGLEKLIGRSDRFMIGAEYHNALGTRDFSRVGLVESSLTSFFASYDFPDYYMMEGFGAYAVFRTNRWLEAAFSYNSDQYSSVERNTVWSLFGKDSVYRLNPPIDQNADEIDLDIYGLSLSLNPRNVLISNRFTAAGSIRLELADNTESDAGYRYNKYEAETRLYYNFEPGSVFKWRLSAGSITGNAPDFNDFFLGGIGTLRGTPYKFYKGNQMIMSNMEVQFGRPSGRSGEWFKDYNLHLLLFLDSGWIQQSEKLLNSTNPLEGFGRFRFSDLQHDAGVGVGSGVLRFELAWPLNSLGDRDAGFDSPTLWVRLNPTF